MQFRETTTFVAMCYDISCLVAFENGVVVDVLLDLEVNMWNNMGKTNTPGIILYAYLFAKALPIEGATIYALLDVII